MTFVCDVCDILLYLSILFSVYVAQTQSLFGACCLGMLLHLRHYLDRVHSDLKQHLIRAVSAHNIWFKQCQGSALPQFHKVFHLFICCCSFVVGKCSDAHLQNHLHPLSLSKPPGILVIRRHFASPKRKLPVILD